MLNIDLSKFEKLKASGRLPSPKGVALAVAQMSQDENASIQEVARVVKSDPALAGRIIKAANGANFSGRRPVASIPDALVVLGVSAVRQLALGFSLVSNFRNGTCKPFDYQDFWSRSLLTAIAVQALTLRTHAAAPEDGFILGLLCRVGCLAFATAYPKEYGTVLTQLNGSPIRKLAELERQAFAMDHNDFTAALLADWGIPKALAEPARHHENPPAGGFAEGSRPYILAHLLHLATSIADACLAPDAIRDGLLPQIEILSSGLGLESEATATLCDQVVREWHDWGRILEVSTRQVPSFLQPVKPEARSVAAGAAPWDNYPLRVLVVDDDPVVRHLLAKSLTEAGHTVETAANGKEALEMALGAPPQLILTDWLMPEMDGVNLCRMLRATRAGRGIYLLVLTHSDDDDRLVTAFEAGADDYLVKPFSPRLLAARLRAAQRVIQLQEEVERDHEEIRRYAAELALINRRLHQAALTDSLTELPNRRYAMDRMHQEWAAASRSRRPLSCMLIDIDGFKGVNDAYGHDAGDQVLRHVAGVLRRHARTQDMISRIGGEEFLVICPGADPAAAYQCAERLRQAVASSSLAVGGKAVSVTVSIGVACRAPEMENHDALIKAADQVLYSAKSTGRDRTVIYPEKSR